MKLIVAAGIVALLCQSTPSVTSVSMVDHLVPLETSYGLLLDYERVSRKALLVTPGEVARFISLPGSASVETSVSVYQVHDKKDSLPGDYWVTVTQSSKSLWQATQSGSKPETVKVERLDAPLPQVVAQTVHETWVRMLMEIKPAPKAEAVMVDSTQEMFSVSKSDGSIIEGQASSRPGPRTKTLIEIAFSLIEYCDKPPALRNKVASDIQSQAMKLTEHDD